MSITMNSTGIPVCFRLLRKIKTFKMSNYTKAVSSAKSSSEILFHLTMPTHHVSNGIWWCIRYDNSETIYPGERNNTLHERNMLHNSSVSSIHRAY